MRKYKILAVSILIAVCLSFTGCNMLARNYGGTTTINLSPGEKLEEITWKESSLWVLTRERREGEAPEDWTFKEYSNSRIKRGTVIVKERE